jgi:hypothetical protein
LRKEINTLIESNNCDGMIEKIIEEFISNFNENQSAIRELDTLSGKMQETMEEFKGPVLREVEILQGFDLEPDDIDECVVLSEILGEGEIIQQEVV